MDRSDEIKEKVMGQLDEIVSKDVFIKSLNDPEAYGHSAGTPLEYWVKEQLSDKGWKVYFPNEFLSEIFDGLKELAAIKDFLKCVFWEKLLITKKQFEDFEQGKPLKRWQQEGADLVLFYGSNLIKEPNKVILLNVKSHELSRKSRDPNIMSAQRLIEFIKSLWNKKDGEKLLESVRLWFIGVNYAATEKGGKIKCIFVKDLFKLDVSKIPQINFDAAIQIQWHVENMIEKEQTNQEFALSLSKEFIERWDKHSIQKGNKYREITDGIKRRLSD